MTIYPYFGDACRLIVPLTDPDTGLPYVPPAGFTDIIFTLKQNSTDPDSLAILQKSVTGGQILVVGSVATVQFAITDWGSINAGGAYDWDLREVDASGAEHTVAIGRFSPQQNVTRGASLTITSGGTLVDSSGATIADSAGNNMSTT